MGLLILLIVLTAIFGIGGVIEGILWAILIGVVLLLATVFVAFQALGGGSERAPRRSH